MVRRMKAEEAAAVAHLMEETIAPLEYYSEAARAAEIKLNSPEALAAMVARNPDTVLVAHVTGAMAGFAVSRFEAGMVWIEWYGVGARYRGRGLGLALLAAVEVAAKARGCHKLWCDCRTNNVKSIAVLTRAGYRQLCELRNFWYGHDYLLWEKPVGSQVA